MSGALDIFISDEYNAVPAELKDLEFVTDLKYKQQVTQRYH